MNRTFRIGLDVSSGSITSFEQRSLLVRLTPNTHRQSRRTPTPAPCQQETTALTPTSRYRICPCSCFNEAERPGLADFLAQAALHAAEGEDEPAGLVTLSTLHAAKGCEWDHVRITGLCEGLLPHEHALRRGEVDEERRLAYVGFTRARRELALSWPRTHHGRPVRASRFLAEAGLELPRPAARDGAAPGRLSNQHTKRNGGDMTRPNEPARRLRRRAQAALPVRPARRRRLRAAARPHQRGGAPQGAPRAARRAAAGRAARAPRGARPAARDPRRRAERGRLRPGAGGDRAVRRRRPARAAARLRGGLRRLRRRRLRLHRAARPAAGAAWPAGAARAAGPRRIGALAIDPHERSVRYGGRPRRAVAARVRAAPLPGRRPHPRRAQAGAAARGLGLPLARQDPDAGRPRLPAAQAAAKPPGPTGWSSTCAASATGSLDSVPTLGQGEQAAAAANGPRPLVELRGGGRAA